MTDFWTPTDDQTQGLSEDAPAAPYAPSNFGDRVGAGAMFYTDKLIDMLHAEAAEHPQPIGQIRPFGGAMSFTTPESNVDPKTLQAQFPGVKNLDEPMPLSVAQDVAAAQKRAQVRANIVARWPSGTGNAVLGLGADAVSGLLDPVSDAAFMVPVVGEARYAAWLARAGESAGLVGRTGVTLGVGALRGMVGQTLLSGADYASGGDPDMTLGDVAEQVLGSGFAGAALHGALSFRGDILGRRFMESAEGDAAGQSADLHDAATRTAAAQLANWDPVEVRPVFDAARTRAELRGSTALGTSVPLPEEARAEASTRLDNAVQRASGAPTLDETRLAGEAAQARATPPDAVLDGQMAEARAAVEGMRSRGELSPDDEAALAALEGDVTVEHNVSQSTTERDVQLPQMRPRSDAAIPSEAAVVPMELQQVQGGLREGVAEGSPAQGRAEAEGSRARNRERLPETGQADSAALREMRSDESGEAPSRLQQASGGDVALSEVPQRGTLRPEPVASRDVAANVDQRAADQGLFAEKREPERTLFSKVPTFYSALTRAVENLKVERAPSAQWLSTIKNLPGVKAEELSWSGVEDFLRDHKGPVTKADLLQHLRENEVNVQEMVKGAPGSLENLVVEYRPEIGEWVATDRAGRVMGSARTRDAAERQAIETDKASGDPKFAQYTLPGGEPGSYRELLLTLPAKDTVTREPSTAPEGWGTTDGGTHGFVERGNNRQDFRSGHFDEPNVLAHVRFDDRTGPNGEKILHVAELQSDWAQRLRRSGPKMSAADLQTELRRITDARMKLAMDGVPIEDERVKALDREGDALRDRYTKSASAPPSMPFATTEGWATLAMRRMIRYAAEHGYDRLSFDTGDTQADRYDLSKQVEAIRANKNADGTYQIGVKPIGKNMQRHDESVPQDKLQDVVGKDLAKRIVAEVTETGVEKGKVFSGLDLKVGGEGMRGFYDKILPTIANKIGKKFGAKVEDSAINSFPDEAHKRRIHELEAIEDRRGLDEDETKEIERLHAEAVKGQRSVDVHSLPITDSMRESVMQGQPLFRRGGMEPSDRGAPNTAAMIRDGAPLKDTLAHIAEEAKDPGYREVAQAVARAVGDDVSLRALGPNARAREPTLKGAYYPNIKRGLVLVNIDDYADPDETLLHEAVHVATFAAIDARTPAGREIEDLFNAYKNVAPAYRPWGAAEQYGFTDANEFIAEAFANPEFREILDAIKDNLGQRTLWQKFVDLVRKVLGLGPRSIGITSDALDRIMKASSSTLNPNDILQRAAQEGAGIKVRGRLESRATTPEEQTHQDQMEAAAAARKKLVAYQDLAKRNTLRTAVEDFHAQGLPLAKGIDALTRGINHDLKGARDSTAAEQLSRQNDFIGHLTSGLEKVPGGIDAWRKRTLTAEWVKELAELNKKDGKPGLTGSKMALGMAKAVQAAQDLARLHLNKSGAWIGDYDGYVSKTRHNAVKIDQAGFEPWRDFVTERLDASKTFADIDQDTDLLGHNEQGMTPEQAQGRFLKNVWDARSTGVHMSSDHGVGEKAAAFTGPANKGRKLSSERVLHWKDADAWREYQERFGDPVIERGVMDGLHRAGADVGLMNRWGSNPAYTFDNLLRTLKEQHRDDHAAVADLQAAEPRLRKEFELLSGALQSPGKSLAYRIAAGTLAWQDITKLSYVLFTHLSVGATKPFQLQYHGMPKWKAYSSVLRNLAQDQSPEGRATMENLRANATGQTQSIMSGYEPIDSVPGKISALRMKVMRLGGLPWMLNRQKSGAQWELANFLGQQTGKEFEALHPATQRVLKIYGIDKPEWDVLRNAPDHDVSGDGDTFLTPQAAQRAPNAAIDSLAPDRIANAGSPENADRIRSELRDRLMMKLSGYLSDSADRSTITPGIPERAMFQRAFGVYGGPIIGQYKTWAAAAVRQTWGQAIYGSSRAEAVKSLAELVAVGTALGYARNVITDALKGKVPLTPNADPKHDIQLLISSMIRGGGLGIVGDMVLGQFDTASGTGRERVAKAIAQFVGPSVGDIADLGGIGFDYLSAALQKHPMKAVGNANAETLRFAIDHTPFINLFYTRTLMNWLILDRLQEWASPGYLKRYQARVKSQTGQSFWLPPSHYLGAQH